MEDHDNNNRLNETAVISSLYLPDNTQLKKPRRTEPSSQDVMEDEREVASSAKVRTAMYQRNGAVINPSTVGKERDSFCERCCVPRETRFPLSNKGPLSPRDV